MKLAIALLALAAAFSVHAQQSADITGDGAQVDQQNIGDTATNHNKTNSHSTQLGNSANANGAHIKTDVDTRDQNTFNPVSETKSHAAGGAAHGNKSDNDNRSSVGHVGSSSGGNALHGTNSAAAKQGQQQGQGQSSLNALGLKASNDSASTSNAQGGTGGASGGNVLGLGASGNSTTHVDASDTSVSRSVAWAPVLHGPAAPALAAANVVVVPGVCGPRVVVARRPIEGVRFGVWGGQSAVQQGYDEVAHDAEPSFVQQGAHLMGHSVTTYTAVVGTSSGGSLSLGGFGRSGDGAQGGGATTGAMQQVVQRVTVRGCVFAQEKAIVVVPAAPVVVPAPPPPAITLAPAPVPKKRAARKPLPQCIPAK